MTDNDRLVNRSGVRGCRHDRGVGKLADWTLRRVVRASAVGAVCPVECREDQHSDNEKQNQQCCCSTFHGNKTKCKMPPTTNAVKIMTVAAFSPPPRATFRPTSSFRADRHLPRLERFRQNWIRSILADFRIESSISCVFVLSYSPRRISRTSCSVRSPRRTMWNPQGDSMG